jgi:hypothetical protein
VEASALIPILGPIVAAVIGRRSRRIPCEWRDAVAHVLLERGVLVGEAHGTELLYLDDEA